ncbi:hypothetical protein ISO77_05870 [Morganella morganii subsp. morganii]|uniref:hypothetical protein n=1 Tax=Morganella morganii TaxID=582 RepID=UPI001BDA5C3A|nr:hypothetical protein [Morganella morganii]MBT0395062.1 hypothetical protein [Morganella morganii subsp. morganii]
MILPEKIRLADINALYRQNRIDEAVIQPVPYQDIFERVKDYERRLRDAIDSEYVYLDHQMEALTEYNHYFSALPEIHNNITEYNIEINGYYYQQRISDLKTVIEHLISDTSTTIDGYYKQIALLEKLKAPRQLHTAIPANTLISGIDDIISMLHQKIADLKTTLESYTLLTALLDNISNLSQMCVTVSNVWQQKMADIAPFLLPDASPEALELQVQALISYFNYFGS